MSLRNEFGMLAVSVLLAGGCDQGSVGELDTRSKEYKTCNSDGQCGSPNCDDINQPNQGAGSDFSMRIVSNPALRYKLTGFFPEAGTWKTRGYLVDQNTKGHTYAKGNVNYAVINGVRYPIVSLNIAKTDLSMTYCSVASSPCPASRLVTLSGTSLIGSQLEIQFPITSGGDLRRSPIYLLTFVSQPQTLDLVKPNAPEITGYSFEYSSSSIPSTALCAGPGGAAQRTLFYQSAYWDPTTFGKTADNSAITVTCELGAIAVCMSWGYKPWSPTSFMGAPQSMDDWHATCVNAKTANYCGDGVSWTKYGTEITINDPLDPPVMTEDVKYVEARWTTKGAACVNDLNRRIPSLAWQTSSCYASMSDCSLFDAKSYLSTGIPVPNP